MDDNTMVRYTSSFLKLEKNQSRAELHISRFREPSPHCKVAVGDKESDLNAVSFACVSEASLDLPRKSPIPHPFRRLAKRDVTSYCE